MGGQQIVWASRRDCRSVEGGAKEVAVVRVSRVERGGAGRGVGGTHQSAYSLIFHTEPASR